MKNAMNPNNQLRTLIALVVLLAVAFLNTLLASVLNAYNEWFAWAVFVVAIALVVVVLRFPQRFTTRTAAALLAVPFVLAVVGALIGGW